MLSQRLAEIITGVIDEESALIAIDTLFVMHENETDQSRCDMIYAAFHKAVHIYCNL